MKLRRFLKIFFPTSFGLSTFSGKYRCRYLKITIFLKILFRKSIKNLKKLKILKLKKISSHNYWKCDEMDSWNLVKTRVFPRLNSSYYKPCFYGRFCLCRKLTKNWSIKASFWQSQIVTANKSLLYLARFGNHGAM